MKLQLGILLTILAGISSCQGLTVSSTNLTTTSLISESSSPIETSNVTVNLNLGETPTYQVSNATLATVTLGALIKVTSKANVEIIVTGTSTKQLLIVTAYRVHLVLNNVSITSSNGPAIQIQSLKKSTVVLNADTTNSLIDGTLYSPVESFEMKGALFAKEGLIIEGSGALTVKSQYKHAIVSDDYVQINNGMITVTSAVKDAIHANDYVQINGGTLHLNASDDGIQVDHGIIVINGGATTIQAVEDGIHAGFDPTNSTNVIVLDKQEIPVGSFIANGGSVHITNAAEGIESKGPMTFYEGTYEIVAQNDGINAAGNLTINGGLIYTKATRGDGLDSNAIIGLYGGVVITYGGANPEGSIDNDARNIYFQGGTLFGLGGSTSFTLESYASQGVVVTSGTSANQGIAIYNGDTLLLGIIPEITFATCIVSSPLLEKGATYTFKKAVTLEGPNQFHGYSPNFTAQGGTHAYTLELTKFVNQLGGTLGPEWINPRP